MPYPWSSSEGGRLKSRLIKNRGDQPLKKCQREISNPRILNAFRHALCRAKLCQPTIADTESFASCNTFESPLVGWTVEIQTVDTRYRLNYSGKSTKRRGKGGIELCQITINTRDKRVIAVICLRSREWNGTHIFHTNACVIRTRQISWIHLTVVFFLVLDKRVSLFFLFWSLIFQLYSKRNFYIFPYKFFNFILKKPFWFTAYSD